MGTQIEPHMPDKRLRTLPDPNGGSADAGGDFDGKPGSRPMESQALLERQDRVLRQDSRKRRTGARSWRHAGNR